MHLWTIALLLVGSSAPDFSAPQGETKKLSLSRGVPLENQPVGYWAVEDTSIEAIAPDKNFGGSHVLSGGPGKMILIKFGDLRRPLGANVRITKASLVLGISSGAFVPVQTISEVLVPWGEGPAQVISFAPPTATGGAPSLSATWRHRRAGEGAVGWQQPGAAGVGDAKPLSGARAVSPDPDHVRIEGIEAAVQRMYDRPYDNHGFALAFTGNIEFDSSQSRFQRPTLEIEYQVEAPKNGPDLAVVRIARTPEYPRYTPGEVHTAVQDGVEVPVEGPPANAAVKHWPANGEEVTYTAVIRNQGNQPSTGFSGRWIVRERPGSATDYDRILEPGAETTVTLRGSFRDPGKDRRGPTIGLVISSKGVDVEPANNGLTIHEAALTMGFRIPASMAEQIAKTRPLGAASADDWAQAMVALWNETLFTHSRFSFAPEGALERVRLQSVEIVSDESGSSSTYDAQSPNLDVAVSVTENGSLGDAGTTGRLMLLIAPQLGIPSLGKTSIAPNMPGRISIGGMSLDRFSQDPWPGVTGGGDTRFEGIVPPMLTLPAEPLDSPMFDAMPTEATGLLSATAVGALNDALGHRRGFSPDALMRLPSIPFLQIFDMSGAPVRNATVEIYPMADGKIAASEPLQRLNSGPEGNVLLSSRPTLLPEGFKTALGFSPTANPFGRVDASGNNGAMLVRVIAGGVADFAFVKAWQMADAYRRNPTPAPFFQIRVNVGGEIDPTTNLASNRIVTDSAGSLPAQLAALIDDQPGTEADLPNDKDAWVDIDLGRDRVFGEIRLFAKGPFWEKFRIVSYATGQIPSEAKLFAREALWSWTSANRSANEGNGVRSVAYRSPGLRARFIRIIRLSDGPPVKLAEIKVFALKGP